MTQQAVGYEDSDIPLASGRLRVRRWGAADAPAVVCVPGLSAQPVRLRPPRRTAGRRQAAAGGDRPARPRPQRGDRRGHVRLAPPRARRARHRGRRRGTVVRGHRPVQRRGHRHDLRAARAVADRAAGPRRPGGESGRAGGGARGRVGEPARHGVPVGAGGHRADQADRHRSGVGRVLGSLLRLRAARRQRRRDGEHRPRRGAGGSRVRRMRCTGRARRRRSTRCGPRSPCRRWCCAPGRRSCRGSGSSCPPRRRSGSPRRCHRHAWQRSTRITTRSRRTTIPSPPSARSCARADAPREVASAIAAGAGPLRCRRLSGSRARRGRRRTRSLRGPPSRRAGQSGEATPRAPRDPVPGVSCWGAPQPDVNCAP